MKADDLFGSNLTEHQKQAGCAILMLWTGIIGGAGFMWGWKAAGLTFCGWMIYSGIAGLWRAKGKKGDGA